MILWYLISYYGIYLILLTLIFMFSISWFWLIIGYNLLIALVYSIVFSLPLLLRMIILKMYRFNWVLILLHVAAGAFGLYHVFMNFYLNPPEIVIGNEPVFFITGMWDISPFRTILLALPFIGFLLGAIYSTVMAPLIMIFNVEEME